MSTTQPIRDKTLLQAFKNYYLLQSPHLRNYTLIVMGLNTALRINDILHLTWDMVRSENSGGFRTHILLKEQKTGKENRILINPEVKRFYRITGYRLESSRRAIYFRAVKAHPVPSPAIRHTGSFVRPPKR